jgi:integrative and conjugative element protein (TIGR02256 family)
MRTNFHIEENHLEFWSKDDYFGLRIPKERIEEMLKYCLVAAPNETGGIIVGKYTKPLDCAFVEKIVGPPKDSKFGRTWFNRGIDGLQDTLNKLWKRNQFYIGEWHFHPNGEPSPSDKDKTQLKTISKSEDYNCLAPILIIIGGNLPDCWNIRTFVFPRDDNFQELIKQ